MGVTCRLPELRTMQGHIYIVRITPFDPASAFPTDLMRGSAYLQLPT